MNNPYGSPPPPSAVSPVNGTLILILGILSIVLGGCGVVLGPIAWVMGNNGLKTLDQFGDPMNQRGTTNGGRICGIVGTILSAVGIVLYVVFVVILGVAGATHPSPTYTP